MKKGFFEGKQFGVVLIISFFLFFFFFIGMVLYYNLNSSSNMLDLLGEKCLESCKGDTINFDWYLLSYTINEIEENIQCDCVKKAKESAIYSGTEIELKTVYLDLRTFEKIKS